jgi:hypothetical protein
MDKTHLQHGEDLMNHIADALGDLKNIPGSRELSLVRTKLDEAMMWSNRVCLQLHPADDQRNPDGPTAA